MSEFTETQRAQLKELAAKYAAGSAVDITKLAALTASAAEMNILDNCTATYHDINAQSTIPHAPAFTLVRAAGASGVANLTYTIKDPGGTALGHCAFLMFWLSDSAAGVGFTSHAPDQLAILSSKGIIVSEFSTDVCALVQANNSGEFAVAITDTHKTLYKACLQSLNGEQISIDTLVVGDYGA